jgi:hypothetical protein
LGRIKSNNVSHGLNKYRANPITKVTKARNIGSNSKMTEIVARKRKMGDRKDKTAPKWPSIKPKNNLHVTRLRDFDLFTVTISPFFSSLIHSILFILLVNNSYFDDFSIQEFRFRIFSHLLNQRHSLKLLRELVLLIKEV